VAIASRSRSGLIRGLQQNVANTVRLGTNLSAAYFADDVLIGTVRPINGSYVNELGGRLSLRASRNRKRAHHDLVIVVGKP
jgi:hypothetical protein